MRPGPAMACAASRWSSSKLLRPQEEDLALGLERLEGGDGLLQPPAAAPMQQVTVEPVGLQPSQRSFAGRHGAIPRGVLGHHLGDQEDLVAAAGNRLADDLLGCAEAVQFGRVDVAQAPVEAVPQSRNGRRPRGPLEMPGSLADGRHCHPRSARIVSAAWCSASWRHYSLIFPACCGETPAQQLIH